MGKIDYVRRQIDGNFLMISCVEGAVIKIKLLPSAKK